MQDSSQQCRGQGLELVVLPESCKHAKAVQRLCVKDGCRWYADHAGTAGMAGMGVLAWEHCLTLPIWFPVHAKCGGTTQLH